jgi:hypothetical protein
LLTNNSWLKKGRPIPFSPHEKEAEALLYSSLDEDAMSFVISTCKDHFTSDYLLPLQDVPKALQDRIQVPDLMFERLIHMREDNNANQLLVRAFVDDDDRTGKVLCRDFWNNKTWDRATSAAMDLMWLSCQLRQLVLLIASREEKLYDKENEYHANDSR